MILSCDKNVISEGVNIVSKVILAKSPVPALEGILFEAYNGGKLKLTGSDIDVGIETYIDVDVEKEGSIIVNCKLFSEILRNLTNDVVKIEVDDKFNMHISCGVVKYTIPCMNPKMYPTIPIFDKEKSIKIKRGPLFSMIRQTLFSVSIFDAKPVLKGILFEVEKERIRLISSDNYRLSIRKEDFASNYDEAFKFVVPGKTLTEIIKMNGEDDDEVSIGISHNYASFDFSGIRVVTKLLKGEFINYQSIIPSSFKTVCKVKTQDLKKAVERASLLVDEKVRFPVKFSIEFDSMIISYRKTEGHSFSDEIGMEKQGDSLEIGFNNKYILSILSVIEDEEILIKLNNPLASMCITPVDDERFFYLVSPMRL